MAEANATTGEIRYARSGDASIAYRVCGDGPTDLLVIGGFVSHLEILFELPTVRQFFDRLGSLARVILFDKRGMGLSDRGDEPYTIENVTADALAVMDAVGSECVALFGVSEGGPASVMIAATHPERVSSMILFGTFARISAVDDLPEGFDVEVLRKGWSRMSSSWGDPASLKAWAPSASDDPELRQWWGRLLRSGASPGVIETIGAMYEQLDVRPLLPSVQAPTLILHREDDRLVPLALGEALAAGIPDARLETVPGADHLLWTEDALQVGDRMAEFLTGRTPLPDPDRVLAAVLFTDVVDSTAIAARLGDSAWSSLLEQFERISEREIAAHRGELVKMTGDGAMAIFDGPARAIRCARSMIAGASSIGLDLRAGIHAGEVERRADDVAGIAVHIASRVEGLAGAGEVATTGTVADLVVGSGLRFRELGPQVLKGVPGEWRVSVVEGED